MKNNNSKPKSRKLIYVAVCLAVVLVAVFAGVYYYTLPNGPSYSSIPKNFSEGAWANYAVTLYNNNGSVYAHDNMNTTIASGIYNNIDCWVYIQNFSYTNANGSCYELSINYLDKSTYYGVHLEIERYTNGQLTEQEAYDPGDDGFTDDLRNFESFSVSARDESVTVPAGTFSCVEREGTTVDHRTSEAYYNVQWLSADVPGWGIVKYNDYQDDTLVGEFVLTNYGC